MSEQNNSGCLDEKHEQISTHIHPVVFSASWLLEFPKVQFLWEIGKYFAELLMFVHSPEFCFCAPNKFLCMFYWNLLNLVCMHTTHTVTEYNFYVCFLIKTQGDMEDYARNDNFSPVKEAPYWAHIHEAYTNCTLSWNQTFGNKKLYISDFPCNQVLCKQWFIKQQRAFEKLSLKYIT